MEKNMKRLYDLLSNSTIFVMFAVAVYFVSTTNGTAYAAKIEESKNKNRLSNKKLQKDNHPMKYFSHNY